MILEALGLLSLGFIVGLSGATIPGPLFAFTVYDVTKKGKITGHLVMLGHVIWESIIILIILLGFGWIVLQGRTVIYILGGPVLILMGLGMISSRDKGIRLERSRTNSSLLGGIFYTAFNPTQPLWWATVGLALLLKGLEVMSLLGVVLVTVGHWLSDFAYYVFVSIMIHRHRKTVIPHQPLISRLLGGFLTVLGGYFLVDALARLLA
ncbi:MAG: LysE family transporter [Candidatus Bathyarchaeota archaeon]|nr:LysE family transporter [Candidatus Bathyarchaeota archaeon]